jgi:hypothetical protein
VDCKDKFSSQKVGAVALNHLYVQEIDPGLICGDQSSILKFRLALVFFGKKSRSILSKNETYQPWAQSFQPKIPGFNPTISKKQRKTLFSVYTGKFQKDKFFR